MVKCCLINALILASTMQGQTHESGDLYPPAIQSFDPLHQRSVGYNSAGIKIASRRGTPDALVVAKSGITTVIPLPEELAQVDSITGAGGSRVVVKGMVNGSGAEIVVFDWKREKITDRFLCYLPEVSPGGRRVAFIKFYPTHSAIGIDHYMIYDVSQSAINNRPTGISAKDWVNTGKPIYPLGASNEPGDNLDKPLEVQYRSASRLFWSADGANLVFAVRVGTELSMVWAKVSEGAAPEVKTVPLDTRSVCDQTSHDDTRQCPVLVTEVVIESGRSPSVTARLTVIGHRTDLVTHRYSEFR